MFCSNCGTKLDDGANFCGNCGAALTAKNEGTRKISFNNLKDNKMFDKVTKATAGMGKSVDKAKNFVKNYTDELKGNEAENNKLAASPMEERIKMRPDGVKYCLVNNTGKILDVYDNKVVFTSTQSTSTVVTGLFFGTSVTQGEKTIYFKDAIGVQYKPSSVLDGYIQVETAAGGVSSSSSQYSGENSIQFSGKERNAEAEIIVNYIRQKIEETKSAPSGGVVQQVSSAEELKKFKELLDIGIITQEEFDAKKKQILGI